MQTSQVLLTMKGKTMSINAGVWIDHHKAVVVLITNNGEVTKLFESNTDKAFASAGGPGTKHPDRPKGFADEDTQEHKFMTQLNTYYDEVLTCLRDADSVLLLGPGEAKGEFQKRLESKKFPAHVVERETADKMTDHQIAASVRQHFAK